MIWRDNHLFAVNTIVPPSGPDAGQATAHWYEIDTTSLGNLTLSDQGNIGGEDIAAGTYTFYPSVAVDAVGNVAVGFAASGPSIYPGAYYAVHETTDAAGTVGPTGTLAAGQDYYYRAFGGDNRWGDYSAISIDPANDLTFWVYNEYAITRGTVLSQFPGEDGRWGTRWGSLRVANTPPTANAGGPYQLGEGASLSLDASLSSDPDSDPLSYTWDVNGDSVFGDATGVSRRLPGRSCRRWELRTVRARLTFASRSTMGSGAPSSLASDTDHSKRRADGRCGWSRGSACAARSRPSRCRPLTPRRTTSPQGSRSPSTGVTARRCRW